MIRYLLLTIAFSFFANTAFGCSLLISPTSDFDTTHYIFIGEIVEVLDNVNYDSQGVKDKAVGFKVKVSENIYSPKQATYFEVFPLRLTPSCGLMSDTKKMRELFSVGSQVRVVAKEATVFKNQPVESSTIRLETSIRNRGSFSRNDLSENLRTTAKTFYDYSSFVQKQGTTAAEDALVESNYYLLEFELEKDLLRLKESKSEDERTKILERLVFYPHVHNLSFPKVGRVYLKNQNKLAALEKQWEQRVQEIYSKQR